MALHDLETYLFRLKNSPAMQEELRCDAHAHLAPHGLDAEATDALARGDIAALWVMGVHPLLLVPYSRCLGMTPPQYRQALQPVAHLRTLRSAKPGRSV